VHHSRSAPITTAAHAPAAGEQYATEHGATSIGLHVFDHNLVARRLYDQLGYQVSSTHMIKSLTRRTDRLRIRLRNVRICAIRAVLPLCAKYLSSRRRRRLS
jgi:hypothetical protein